MLVVFSPIFVADTKIIFPDDFVAPFKSRLNHLSSFFSNYVIHNQREIFEWNTYCARKKIIIFFYNYFFNTVYLKYKFKKYSERS